MRKLVGVFLFLFLIGCAPTISVLFGDPEQGSLELEIGRTSTKVIFAAGNQDALDVALYIGGNNLSVNDNKCTPEGNGFGCILGTVAAGGSYEVTVQGSQLSANVTYLRSGSAEPLLLLAEVTVE